MGNINKYIVYKHTCLANGKVYIGITSRSLKARAGKHGQNYFSHNPYFGNAIKKYGWENGFSHEVLLENLSKEEAELKEIELIAFYKSNQKQYGYNICDGGNCTDNPSAETREKIRKSLIGRTVSEETREKLRIANLGQKRSEEAKKHMSESAKKRKHSKMSEETKQKIGNANRGKKITEEQRKEKIACANKKARSINQYDLNGLFIYSYESASSAQRETGIGKSKILSCCKRESLYKTAGGFQWRFADDNDDIKSVSIGKGTNVVLQYDINHNLIAEYESPKIAANTIGANESAIRSCCRGSLKTYKGYIWKYKN